MGGSLAPLAGQVLRDRAPQRHGELQRELALSGRPANPPPPGGESEEEGGDAEGDASPAPAPQPMTYIRPMGGPFAPPLFRGVPSWTSEFLDRWLATMRKRQNSDIAAIVPLLVALSL